MKKSFNHNISTFKNSNIIYGFYYCDEKNVKYSKNGDMYLDILLTDSTTSIYAKIWNHPDYFNSKFASNSSVAIKGKVVKYRDRLELNIFNINTASMELYSQYGFKKSIKG